MKRNLGRIFLVILFFLHIDIFASTYEWSVVANKKSASVHEAIYLTYSCRFSDKGELYSIEFNPVGENEEYSIKLLSESEKIVDGKRVNSYEFVAFAKKAKKIDFKFNAMMKLTTKKSIENTIIGRDNINKEYFTSENIKQKVVTVDVIDSKSDLVGDFVLEAKYSQSQVKAHEPFHFDLNIKGVGNFQDFKPIVLNIDGVKVIAESPNNKTVLSKDGYSGVFAQKFAFVGERDFTVPAISVYYFDINSKTVKKLETKPLLVKVSKGYEKQELLDSDNENFSWLKKEYLYYLLSFIAGFIVSRIKFKKRKTPVTRDEKLKNDIKNAKTVDEVIFILALQNKKEFNEIIKKIEKGEIVSLRQIQENLLQLISH